MSERCSIENCDRPREKRTWCATHYQRWRRHGDPEVNNNPWAERAEACLVCGDSTAESQYRQFCSHTCRAFARRAKPCRLCGGEMEIRQGPKLRVRGNGLGYCVKCSRRVPCPTCGGERVWRCNRYFECNPCARAGKAARAMLRRARQVGAVCEHGPKCVTEATLGRVVRDQKCIYCGADAEHADHFEPLARGGAHCVDNLVPACAPCNLSKQAHEPWQWWAARAEGGAA